MHEVLPWLEYIALSLRIPGRPHVEFIAAFMLINAILYTAVGVACTVLFAYLRRASSSGFPECSVPQCGWLARGDLGRASLPAWNWNTGRPTSSCPLAGPVTGRCFARPFGSPREREPIV
jgi:hypothetical protein